MTTSRAELEQALDEAWRRLEALLDELEDLDQAQLDWEAREDWRARGHTSYPDDPVSPLESDHPQGE